MLANLTTKERMIYAAILVGLLVFAGVVGRSYLDRSAPIVFDQAPMPPDAVKPIGPTGLQVHVAGAVKVPGVFHFGEGARVFDAIKKAGGAKPSANLDSLNLAAKLEDATQLYVPSSTKPETEKVIDSYKGGADSASAQTYASTPRPPEPTTRGSGKKNPAPSSISLNRSSSAQLQQLPGVGPSTAQKIVDYRQEHGGFSSIDELMAVKGIGPKKMEKMRKFLKL